MSKKSLAHRSEVPIEETWNLESIFPSPEQWEKTYQRVQAQLPEVEKYQGKLSESPQILLKGLDAFEKVFVPGLQVYIYAGLAASVDVGDQEATARFG